jgi:hypothetical protein
LVDDKRCGNQKTKHGLAYVWFPINDTKIVFSHAFAVISYKLETKFLLGRGKFATILGKHEKHNPQPNGQLHG